MSGTFGTAWDKYSKNSLTFGCLREKKRLKFWHGNYFFQAKTGFWNFYINIYEYLKPDLKNLMSGLSESVEKCTKSWKLDFFNKQLFIFEIESFNFCICQKTTFAWSYLEQVSSWWIKSKFCVYKVSIWKCLVILTFSGLHFLYYMTPLNFQQGLVQPPVD